MAAHSVSTVDPQDRESFAHLGEAWWDRRGAMYPLHHLNPERVKFIVEHARKHYGMPVEPAATADAVDGYYKRLSLTEAAGIDYDDSADRLLQPAPLAHQVVKNLSVLDVGCGGGILAEPMAYFGAEVTGVDSVGEGLPVARAHAAAMGLNVEYMQKTVEELADSGRQFDVVMVMEVVEHVANVPLFLDACARLVKPGGFFVLSTPNRNVLSYLAVIIAAEWILRWIPRGMHRWTQFLKPDELEAHLRKSGLVPTLRQGFVFDPLRWRWFICGLDWIDYIVTAVKPQ